MNRCPNCAAQNREGAKFCTSCGFKLPVAAEPPMAPFSDRSPFATTSTVPSAADHNGTVRADEPVQVDDDTTVQSFSTWEAQTDDKAIELPGPGSSWDAEPPKDTAVPVSDEMIETLVGGFPPESPEVGAPPDDIEAQLPEVEADDQVAVELQALNEQPIATAQMPSTSLPNIDHLLKIARELEYGLFELAENLPAGSVAIQSAGPVDASELGGALANLQSDDDLQALREAVETARQRPRDVDVMLDLVLRAGAIATVIEERDTLKAAIEAATGGSKTEMDADSTIDDVDDTDDGGEADLDLSDSADDDAESSPYAST